MAQTRFLADYKYPRHILNHILNEVRRVLQTKYENSVGILCFTANFFPMLEDKPHYHQCIKLAGGVFSSLLP